MPKLVNIKAYSLNTKVALALFTLAVFLFTILFFLIVPKMQKKLHNHTLNQIEQMLELTSEEIIIAGKAIRMQSLLEEKQRKSDFEKQLFKLKYSIDTNNTNSDKTLKQAILKFNKNNKCVLSLKKEDSRAFDTWFMSIKNLDGGYNKPKKTLEYLSKLKYKSLILHLGCEGKIFNQNHKSFEATLKETIQKSFKLSNNIHKGKIYLLWLNKKYTNDDRPLYDKKHQKYQKKYNISNMSNVIYPLTGSLSAKDLIAAINKEAILHLLNDKETMTWVKKVYENERSHFLLISSSYKEDFNNNIDSAFWIFLPASLIALFFAIFAAFFIFRRLFKAINVISKTAIEVNRGNKNIRSHIKGNDNIGNLGFAFDSMLDSFENNIKTLDLKVEEKTKELQSSLDEKEVLLKEIHHRVKNNLGLTIALIKLQQNKIEDIATKNILNNIQDRIYTMELLHRKLYESNNLNLIPFREYIPSLVYDISKSYDYKHAISYKFNIDDIYLDIQKALPCGLILNEIISNAFKYAFINNKHAQLSISMKEQNNKYILCIKDNGKGLNKDITIEHASTLGLKLIHSIAKLQLRGKINYEYLKGSIFSIEF